MESPEHDPTLVVRRNTVTLPGTPREPQMAEARKEVVGRLLNTSLDMVLDRSQDVIIEAIFNSPRMQTALKAFEVSSGQGLRTAVD